MKLYTEGICMKLAYRYNLPLQMACQDIITILPLISWGEGQLNVLLVMSLYFFISLVYFYRLYFVFLSLLIFDNFEVPQT